MTIPRTASCYGLDLECAPKVSCGGRWGLGKVIGSQGTLHSLFGSWVHNWVCCWEVGSGQKRWSTGVVTRKDVFLSPAPFLSLCFLAAVRWEVFLCHVLPRWGFCLGSSRQWTEFLESWAALTLPFKLWEFGIVSSDRKSDGYTYLINLINIWLRTHKITIPIVRLLQALLLSGLCFSPISSQLI